HAHDQAAIRRVGDCALEPVFAARAGNSQLDAFLFWSRTPFAERAEDGSVIVRDARFTEPLTGDNFVVRLPDMKCVELSGG
ncbi:MAG: hypothetical protein AAF692_11930, partial [Pseudomonadota bacterium]